MRLREDTVLSPQSCCLQADQRLPPASVYRKSLQQRIFVDVLTDTSDTYCWMLFIVLQPDGEVLLAYATCVTLHSSMCAHMRESVPKHQNNTGEVNVVVMVIGRAAAALYCLTKSNIVLC